MAHASGYGQFCPVTRAVEVLGERWSMLIVRDMLCGFTRFNDLARGLPGLSRSLLAKRLRQLEMAGVVRREGNEYRLTEAGEDLREVVFGIGAWGARWQLGTPRDTELDPELLMWWMHTRLDFSALPAKRIVLGFNFRGERRRFWIVNDAAGASVCTSDPGFEVDIQIDSDLRTLYEVWLGRRDLGAATRAGDVALHGKTAMVRQIPRVFQLSPMAQFSMATR